MPVFSLPAWNGELGQRCSRYSGVKRKELREMVEQNQTQGPGGCTQQGAGARARPGPGAPVKEGCLLLQAPNRDVLREVLMMV